MQVLVWGIGYVGIVTAACLAQAGHHVIGIDMDSSKVEAVASGRSPFPEPGLDTLLRDTVAAGRLTACREGTALVGGADLSLVCVGTPGTQEGETYLGDLEAVAGAIGDGLRDATAFHTVVLRSTVFPGCTRQLLLPILEQRSLRRAGQDFGLAVNPEFLREGSAIEDFLSPPYVIVGAAEERSALGAEALYQGTKAALHRIGLEEAELLKMVNNAFHGLKIGFANEIGRLCEPLGLDSHAVMRLVCADTKLNLSPAYLRPGFPFGGSCLPKDLRALNFQADRLNVELPILEAILPSNACHLEGSLRRVRLLNLRSVGLLGLSFKPGTGDLRESPALEIACRLHAEGFQLRLFDPDIRWETLPQGVQDALRCRLPGIEQMLCSHIHTLVEESEALVVCQRRPEFRAVLQSLTETPRRPVLDLCE